MILKNTLGPRLRRTFTAMCLMVAFVFPVCAEVHRKPLDKTDVLRMLKAKEPDASVEAQIRQQKISFAITKPVIDELKTAGASRPVLEALRAAQPVGLVWSAPTVKSLSSDAMVEITPMVVDGGHDYFACTSDQKRVALVTNAGGAWKLYPVAPELDVGNNGGARIIGLAVNQGVAYVPMIPNNTPNAQIVLAYNPGGNPAGPWVKVLIYSSDSSTLENPSAAVAADELMVAFDDWIGAKGKNDVFLATIPLSGLRANGKVPPVKIVDISKADDYSGGPSDERPELVVSQGEFNLAWEQGGKSILFIQAQVGSVPNNLPKPQVLHTASDPTDKSLVLAATGDHAVLVRFEQTDSNDPGCCEVSVTHNAGGSWATNTVGRTNLAVQTEGVAVGDCGASVAYMRAVTGNVKQVTVATFADGQWRNQDLGGGDAYQPRLAATSSGLDLIYDSGSAGQIIVRSGVCYAPPAPLD
jgi:hypothetical protein